MAHVRTYNPSVRVGNWNEDIQLEEDTLKDFLRRRDNGQLLIQKSSSVVGKMNEPIQLSTSSDGTVYFGNTVMVVNRGNPDRTIYALGVYPRDDSALAINMSRADGAGGKEGNAPSTVTGTKNLSPSFRTAFKIMPADEYAKVGDKLRYGQPFTLMTATESSSSLFLFSDQVLFNRSTAKSRHQVAQLVSEQSFKTSWQIEHKNPLVRLEYENSPVLANENCIIKHQKTYQNLCVEEKCNIQTLFGTEYEISAHTNLDSHKADQPVNLWRLMMAVAGDATYPMSLSSTGDQEAKDVKLSV